jgi:hypothetical protein
MNAGPPAGIRKFSPSSAIQLSRASALKNNWIRWVTTPVYKRGHLSGQLANSD